MNDVINALKDKGYTIATMESCTGGNVVNEITNIENASEVLQYSAITYSNLYKIKMGVNEDTINNYGVYSIETAKEMAKSISNYANSTLGIGITGKLKKSDKNNKCANDDVVFVSIYDKNNKIYYNKRIMVIKETRVLNKKMVTDAIIKMLLEILNS